MSPPFTLEEKVAIAEEWLKPLLNKQATTTYEELAARFQKPDEPEAAARTIRYAIRDAFASGLIYIERAQVIPEYYRSSELEGEISRIIWNPRQHVRLKSIVVESKEIASSRQAHIQVGSQLGIQLLIDREFRPGDRIGVGSGRGVYYTVDAMLKRPEERFRELPDQVRETYIMSLMGSVFPNSVGAHRELLYDSDLTASLLARCFDGLVHMRPIASPIALPPEEKEQAITRTWLGDDFDQNPPNFAIVGLGLLDSDHRFHQIARNDGASPQVLASILPNLRKLVAIVDGILGNNPTYNPVADVCGRMFLVPPPRNFGHERELLEIEHLISRLNECLVTVTKTKLGKVLQKVILVAATEAKARGLFYLLRHDRMRVDQLAIDGPAARMLLRMAKEAKLDVAR